MQPRSHRDGAFWATPGIADGSVGSKGDNLPNPGDGAPKSPHDLGPLAERNSAASGRAVDRLDQSPLQFVRQAFSELLHGRLAQRDRHRAPLALIDDVPAGLS